MSLIFNSEFEKRENVLRDVRSLLMFLGANLKSSYKSDEYNITLKCSYLRLCMLVLRLKMHMARAAAGTV